MGTALTTSSGLEPIQGTLTCASDALSVDEPSQEMVFWNPPQPCDLGHLVSSLQHWSLLSGRVGGATRPPGLCLCASGCLPLNNAV